MDSAHNFVTISCHCGAARQTLSPRGSQDLFSGVLFCHCDTCRHSTGLLCTSYAPVSPPSVAGLQSYSTSPASTRYFCSTCGCHVFRAKHYSPSAPPEEWEWEVATGTITDAPESNLPQQWHHRHTNDTKDGGLSQWLPNTKPPLPAISPSDFDESRDDSPDDTLKASCHCTAITLLITRPSPDPALNPDSPYPDLLLPYTSTPTATVANPSHEKWYLRPVSPSPSPSTSSTQTNPQLSQKTKYLAGTCTCNPCRLTSGFEIQTWAFIPRRNISILIPPSSSSSSPSPNPDNSKLPGDYHPLDFTTLPRDNPLLPLKDYPSSPGRIREFCSTCGATVFWHDIFRPDLIDVSAGLFRAVEGARAGSWLEWWTGRVSFSEEASREREGGARGWGQGVVKALEGGMRGSNL
ncbi:Mss4-like protein [Parachaetomium inaequale]|uniref:Mss4-like protein n=1 Tax=Parachaetomium inaequale TaxID=2588326 RepID=A0AAN6SQQ0_9PEZI|nr:Mss4-like protein [Parachaetomium inaequale]